MAVWGTRRHSRGKGDGGVAMHPVFSRRGGVEVRLE